MSKIGHLGTIKNGNFKPLKPELLKKELHSREGKMVYLSFDDYFPEKTPNLLGFYHGGIIKHICMNTEMFGGWEAIEIRAFFEDMFLKDEVVRTLKGQSIIVPIHNRLSSLTNSELSLFVNKVIQWLAENDIVVMDPDVYLKSKYRSVKNG